jgi:regulator of sigma E protease
LGISFKEGNNYISKAELNKEGLYAGALGKEVGFQLGDKVLKVNGEDFHIAIQILLVLF